MLALGDCARVTYPAALQRCKFDTPLLAAGLLIEHRNGVVMHLSKEEQILLKHFSDMIHMSYQRGIPVFSQFVSLHEVELASQALDDFYGKQWYEGEQVVFFGGYQDAERKIICFLPGQSDIEVGEEDFPVCCVRAMPVNKRFCDSLNHRDFLGAIMNLGLTRDQIGDILVKQEENMGCHTSTGYIFCKQDKAGLLEELTRIKHTTIVSQVVDFTLMDWQTEFKEIAGSVSSCRLDAVLSLAARVSRSQGLALVQSGSVFLNGRCCTENAKKLTEGDILSVRGYGRFLFAGISTQSKKGRYHVTVKQYI